VQTEFGAQRKPVRQTPSQHGIASPPHGVHTALLQIEPGRHPPGHCPLSAATSVASVASVASVVATSELPLPSPSRRYTTHEFAASKLAMHRTTRSAPSIDT
jgi:hypothetical protein